jgi:hypothetical protein
MVYSIRIGLCQTIVACEINKEDKALVVHGKSRRHLFNWEKKIKGSMIFFFKGQRPLVHVK